MEVLLSIVLEPDWGPECERERSSGAGGATKRTVVERLALVPFLGHAGAGGEVADREMSEDLLRDLGGERPQGVCGGLARGEVQGAREGARGGSSSWGRRARGGAGARRGPWEGNLGTG